MTAIQKMEAEEKRQDIFDLADGLCKVCGEPVNRFGTAQLAHRIAKTKPNIKKYGNEIINHKNNLVPVCSLKCNASVNIGFNPVCVSKLVDNIQRNI